MVTKKKDPDKFTILCTIEVYKFCKVLCDHGESIICKIVKVHPLNNLLFNCLKMNLSHCLPSPIYLLGEKNTLPIIIVIDISPYQMNAMKSIVKKLICAIMQTIADIIGISPSIFCHKIKLQVDHVPSIEHKKRLNPSMQEVVKKKIIKWYDTCVSYKISNSMWVIQTQCIPSRGERWWSQKIIMIFFYICSAMGQRVYMHFHILNSCTEKDHFPMPFIDKILD